jgi:ribosomal protein S18 acetylase RimI-like enzyme
MSGRTGAPVTIAWYEGSRASLRHLFELADDSAVQIDGYIGEGRVLVALDETGEIVGHLQLVPTDRPGTVELKSVAVREDLRRRGIGRRLVDRALEVCRAEEARALTVTTATADIENIRFYQRCGFRAVAVERDAFTPARGYPPGLEADGIPVRDSITFALPLDAAAPAD